MTRPDKGAFHEPDVCVDCRVDTPEKFAGCDNPCSKYRYERAVKAGEMFAQNAQRSVQAIKSHPLEEDSC